MKKLIFLALLLPLLSFNKTTDKDRKIDVKLIGIEYYSKGTCNADYPVYVRIKYAVRNFKLDNLKMKHVFSNGVTSTMRITETDKKGNVVYGFCTSKDEKKSFKTIFFSKEGAKSKEIHIDINVPDAKIIAGTAPQTIKK